MPAVLEPEEVLRINRVRLALLLHKTPAEIDEMPLQDVCDIMEVQRGEQLIDQWRAARQAAKARSRRR